MSFSFYVLDGDHLVPTSAARSLWSADQMHGVAVSAALSRGAQASVTREDLRPARYSLEMFRPATMGPLSVESTVVRESRRLCLVDTRLVQDGETRARASTLFLSPSRAPQGRTWTPDEAPAPPPLEVAPVATEPHVPWFRSSRPWSQDFLEHQNEGRKTTWQHGVPVVPDEEPTPFTSVASIADATTMVCNWSTNGVEYINTDITLSLARLPRTGEVGLHAIDWAGDEGIAVGTATVFDREGPIGSAMVTALANSHRTVDFEKHELTEDGDRQARA